MISAGLVDTNVISSQYEMVKYDSPAVQTCGQYFSEYLGYEGTSGGLINPESTGQCLYCSVRKTAFALATMGIDVSIVRAVIGCNLFTLPSVFWTLSSFTDSPGCPK